jgi:hypothetical protein
MAKLIAFLSSFLAIFLFIGMAAYFRYYAPAGGFLHRDLDPAAVVHEVQRLSDLVTVRYVVEKVVGLTEEKQPLGSESILLMVQGKVLAGIKLGEFNQYNIESLKGHNAVIRLPPPAIMEAFLDESNTKVWDRRITWWTPWVEPDKDLEHKARMQALDDIRQAAVKMGILDDARRNAETAIRKFLGTFGITAITIHETD